MPSITNIARSKTKRDFVNVFLDDEFWFSCPDSAITDNYLFIGKELTDEEVPLIIRRALFSKYYYRILNILSIRPRSEWEIKAKLKQYHLKEKTISVKEAEIWDSITQDILDKLSESGYISDEKFGAWFIDSRLTQKKKSWGEIEQGLFVKGLSNAVVSSLREKYKAKISKYEKHAIKKLAGRKLKSHNPGDILKFKQYLFTKGFNTDAINEEVDFTSEN